MSFYFKSEESYKKAVEAGERGRRHFKEIRDEEKRIYYLNPSLCGFCGKPLEYKRRNESFCSHSCSAIVNNKKRAKSKIAVEKKKKAVEKKKEIMPTKTNFCLQCGKKIPTWQKYCSHSCATKRKSILIIESKTVLFENGELTDEQARVFFRKTTENKICSICGCSEWMGSPMPLVVDHIDGNHNNNFPENLRFVCCNCDAQLDTYKSKNKGNGRTYRKKDSSE